jgi:hypothetical protein
MAFLNSSAPGGKKQASMPGPNSPTYKKIIAATKAAKGGCGKPAAGETARKHPKSGAAYSSVKARQALVERVKRQIWAAVTEINEAIIALAKAGNFNAAKALFDFAGVYSLPVPGDEATKTAADVAPSAEGQPQEDPVDTFFRSIGIARDSEPEPATADR